MTNCYVKANTSLCWFVIYFSRLDYDLWEVEDISERRTFKLSTEKAESLINDIAKQAESAADAGKAASFELVTIHSFEEFKEEQMKDYDSYVDFIDGYDDWHRGLAANDKITERIARFEKAIKLDALCNYSIELPADVPMEGDSRVVKNFRDRFDFLSNFYPCKITIGDVTYNNAEAAFQAAKLVNKSERAAFAKLSGKEARAMGRKIPLRSDWNKIRVGVMRYVLAQKFYQNSELIDRLIFPSNLYFVEENSWNDTFWGVCNGVGQNILGRLLMEFRDSIIEEMDMMADCRIECA